MALLQQILPFTISSAAIHYFIHRLRGKRCIAFQKNRFVRISAKYKSILNVISRCREKNIITCKLPVVMILNLSFYNKLFYDELALSIEIFNYVY